MSETNDTGDKKLTLGGRKTLQLKKTVDASQVRQSLSHGRAKSVVVERKRHRVVTRETQPGAAAPQSGEVSDAESLLHGTLTQGEREVRIRALEEARKHDDEVKHLEEELAQQEKPVDEVAEPEAETAPPSDDASVPVETPEEIAAKSAAAAEPVPGEAPRARGKAAPAAKKAEAKDGGEADERGRKARLSEKLSARPRPSPRTEPRRRDAKLTVVRALQDDGEERQRSLAAIRRAREKQKAAARQAGDPPSKVLREVVLPETITVAELANRMAERANDVMRELMKMEVMVAVTDSIDADTAELVITEMGHKVRRVTEADVEVGLFGDTDDEKDLSPRPPVVTVMGHVDHGKTSLLDALRETNVVSGEAGGITQHIGAYQISTASGDLVTFLDTPGHEAFTAMRARGAKATDIVVLVVAADDGIMPQTIEAIQHAKAAEAPIIVAINKMDRPEANADRVRQDLLQHEIVVEEMGGDVLNVEVSATKRTNLDKLAEAIALQAEVLELKANQNRPGEGVVIEATLERGRGPVATLLVTRGTLRIGDIFVAGAEWGRVRALVNDKGEQIKQAVPSQPVEVLGLNGTPVAGDDFSAVENESRAREITEYRQRMQQEAKGAQGGRASLEAMLEQLNTKATDQLPLVIKSDVQGSAEAIAGALDKMSTEEVAAKVLLSGVGGITESDITLARASGAPILAFNVRASGKIRAMADEQDVEIRNYSVIYNLVDDIKAILSGMLAPAINETILGVAEVKDVFAAGRSKAAGCIVVEGSMKADARARLLRDSIVVYDGKVSSLRRFKDEVKEVNAGTECGLTLDNYEDIKVGDLIELYEQEEIARSLD